MPQIIRAATPTDLSAITRIYDHAVRQGTASFEIEPPDEAEMTRRYQALLQDGYPYLVAELDGHVAGYAYAGVVPIVRGRPIAGRWRIRSMSIRPPIAEASDARCSMG